MRLKIAVNTRFLVKNKLEGIGWYTHEVVRRLVLEHPEVDFYFLFDRKYDADFIYAPNVFPIVIYPSARHPFLWVWWFEIAIFRALKKIKPDLFFSPDGYLSLRSKAPTISVIHDINFEHRTQDLPYLAGKYYRYFFRRYAQKAQKILTVSEFSRQDIISTYSIDSAKVKTAYNGASDLYNPNKKKFELEIKQKYTSNHAYFLFVGALHPRKNLVTLLHAFELFKKTDKTHMKLLIVGDRMFKNDNLQKQYEQMKFRADVIFAGRKQIEELSEIVASAVALVFVPFFEGFGLPALEAMQSGTPVICSNTTSLPEVVGNAALVAAPEDYTQIANHMTTVAENPELCNLLKEKGLLQARKFKWNDTAKTVWNEIIEITKKER